MPDVLHVRPVGDQVEHDTSTSEPDCACGPTVEPVKRDDGSMGWLIVHHSLDVYRAGELRRIPWWRRWRRR